ncbi:hypothetical protein AVEN_89049-1 [Araneus ventricosus]|uniref:Uncharacterized protein n=1 Tax=Araneus ventricosus TaxID=182803 RepID=A0A4Y2B4J1_ARAVE|nr:hypothetical protein AVEN_89049-1 [Araneus ventricosus]
MLSDGDIVLHGIIHTVLRIAAKFQVGSLNPQYSPDLAPNMGSKHLSVARFSSDSDVKTAAENCLNGPERYFYLIGLNKLVQTSDKCLNRFGDYAEK